MKLIVAFAFAVMGSSAFAEVKQDGFVFRLYCAPAQEVGPIRLGGYTFTEACTAAIQGKAGKYVVITESAVRRGEPDVQHQVWQVKREVPGRSGVNQRLELVGTINPEGLYEESLAAVLIEGSATVNMVGGFPRTMSGVLDGRRFQTTALMEGIVHTETIK